MANPTPVRFPPEIDRAVALTAKRFGMSKSAVVIRAVDEWLRMEAHPRVTFCTANTGERRALVISGPQVWTIVESWQQHSPAERTVETVADTLDLPVVDIEAALNYWAEYRDEIDTILEVHEATQAAALAAWEKQQALRAV